MDSPRFGEEFLHSNAVQNLVTAFPVGVFHRAVFYVKRVSRCCRPVDELAGRLLIVDCYLDPNVFQRVGNLPKQVVNGFKAVSEHLVHPVLDGAPISEVGYPDFAASLPNSLNAALALLKARWIPWKVNVDERSKALEVESLRSCIGAEQKFEFPVTNSGFKAISVAALKPSFSPETRSVASGVKPDF